VREEQEERERVGETNMRREGERIPALLGVVVVLGGPLVVVVVVVLINVVRVGRRSSLVMRKGQSFNCSIIISTNRSTLLRYL